MAPLTSSAINKGKKLAPKAAVARRRPAAAQPTAATQPSQSFQLAQSTPAPAPETTTAPDTAAGAAQPGASSTQSERPISTAPLPTPPATQQAPTTQPAHVVVQQSVRQPTPPPPASLPHHVEPSPLSLAQSDASHHQTITSPSPQPLVASTPPVTQPEQRQPNNTTNEASPHVQRSPTHGPPSPNQLAGHKRKRPTPPPAATSDEPTLRQPSPPATTQQAQPPAASDPEAALINTLISHQEQPRAPVAQMLPPANTPATASKPRAKRQRKTDTTTEPPGEADDSSQAVEGAQENDSNTTPAAKPRKPRAPRAKRQQKSAATVVEDENGNAITTEDPAPRPVPKPRKPRQKKKSPQQLEEGTNGQDEIENPENHEIDVAETTMLELTKDRGLGKVSERETKMAAIDWDEVHRKRVAEAEAIRAGIDPASLNNQPTENTEAGDGGEGENTEETPRPAPVATGPRLRIDAEGNLVVDEDSLRIDRQAQAER
ncbi:hypothetical protein KCU82_g18500, partial [Aureobasidium melanogenum]